MNLKLVTIVSFYILKRVNGPRLEIFINIFKTLVGKKKKHNHLGKNQVGERNITRKWSWMCELFS